MALYQNYPYTDLQTLNLDGVIRQEKVNTEAIAAETAARESADATLQQNINDEAAARAAADQAEAAAREYADRYLQQQINVIDPTAQGVMYPYTPQMFGAAADGITDDTIAIQNCINAAHSDGRGVYFPGGVYGIGTSTVDYGSGLTAALRCYDGDVLFGYGNATLKRINASVERILFTNSNGNETEYNAIHSLMISGLNFDMQPDLSPTSGSDGFQCCHAENVTIQHCKFKGFNGWHCIEINSTRNSRIIDCDFSECYQLAGATFEQCEHIQIDAAISGVGAWGALDGTVCYNLLLSGNRHSCNDAVGVGNHSGAAHHDIIITDCFFENYTGTRGAISFVANQINTAIHDCIFHECAAHAVQLSGSNVTLTNCQFNGGVSTYIWNTNGPEVNNCWINGSLINGGTLSYDKQINANTMLTNHPVRSYSIVTNNNINAAGIPVRESGVLFTNKISGAGRFGSQIYASNSGLYQRTYNENAASQWAQFLTNIFPEITDLNDHDNIFWNQAFPGVNIKAFQSGASNKPSSDAGIMITFRNAGSGNFGSQLVITNHNVFVRGQNNGVVSSWVTAAAY